MRSLRWDETLGKGVFFFLQATGMALAFSCVCFAIGRPVFGLLSVELGAVLSAEDPLLVLIP